MPPIELCSTLADVQNVYAKMPVVLKPLYGFGGKNNILLSHERCIYNGDVSNWEAIQQSLEYSFANKEQWLAMQYLPRYHEGDKRILVVAGEVVGASLRLPLKSNWLCNISSGGRSVQTQVNDNELAMVSKIANKLDLHGIQIFGIDTLVADNGKRVLSEINTLCPGGFYTLYNTLKQTDAVSKTVQTLSKMSQKHSNVAILS